MSEGSFWKSRLANEAIGVLLMLAGVLAVLALFSYDPRDPNIFSWTAGGEAAAPNNWIGGFGASLAAALYALFGLASWGVASLVLFLGWRRFWQSDFTMPQAYGGAPLTLHHFTKREIVSQLQRLGFEIDVITPVGIDVTLPTRKRDTYGFILKSTRKPPGQMLEEKKGRDDLP